MPRSAGLIQAIILHISPPIKTSLEGDGLSMSQYHCIMLQYMGEGECKSECKSVCLPGCAAKLPSAPDQKQMPCVCVCVCVCVSVCVCVWGEGGGGGGDA